MLVSYRSESGDRIGVVSQGRLADIGNDPKSGGRPASLLDVIERWDDWRPVVDGARATLARDPAQGVPVDEVRLLAPIASPRRNPYLIAGNYRSHVDAGERATGVPLSQRKTAIFFTKPPGSIVGPVDDIEYDPRLTIKLDYEIELVVVIGRGGRDIPAANAMEHVFGYMIGNDVSARDIQIVKPTSDFLRGKGMDTFFPTGPGIVPASDVPDYRKLAMRLTVNGELKQSSTPADLIRDVAEIIAELSRGLTLHPGDMIATGTPSGTQVEQERPVWLTDGDRVICEIEGIGRLINTVRAR